MQNNNKIMFVIPSLEGGGAERVASILLRELSARGLDIVLVLFSKKSGYGIPENVNVRYIDINTRKSFLQTVVRFFYIIIKLKRIIKEEKPFNILSLMDYTNIVLILGNLFVFEKSKVIISVRSSPILYLHKYSMSPWDRIVAVLIRLLYNRAKIIISVSDFIKDDLIENFKVRREKIIVINNPVDANRLNALAGEDVSHPWFKDSVPIIIGVGRLSKEKGFDYLIRAIAMVREKTEARLFIAGEGVEENNLKELSLRLGIDKCVYFSGFQKNPYKYMKRSTIFVLSSLFEGFPNVLTEAMMCGVPVISTIYNPGYDEIIENEKNGLLVPVADEKALAETMLRLLNNPEERKRYSAAAKEKAKQFCLEHIVEQYRSALMDVTNG